MYCVGKIIKNMDVWIQSTTCSQDRWLCGALMAVNLMALKASPRQTFLYSNLWLLFRFAQMLQSFHGQQILKTIQIANLQNQSISYPAVHFVHHGSTSTESLDKKGEIWSLVHDHNLAPRSALCDWDDAGAMLQSM